MKKVYNFIFVVLLSLVSAIYAQQGEIKTPKYVFFFIGDGMSATQVHTTEAYLQQSTIGSDVQGRTDVISLNMTQMPVVGLQTTYATDRFITDSAAAGSALACGQKTSCGTIGMNASRTEVLPSIAEKARDKGMKVGIVSSVSIDHATPACFYAHQPSREHYWQISQQLGDSGFNYFAGGGMKGRAVSGGKRSYMPDKPEANDDNDPLVKARRSGYTIATTRQELAEVKPGTKTFAYSKNFLDGGDAMPYEIDRPAEDLSLAEYTAEGIRLLNNPDGFFMMIEGGKIDWACHANDARTVIDDVIAFDNAIKVALDFYNKHKDETLIVVTGDHETGGMTMGFAGTQYSVAFEMLANQKMSMDAFNAKVLGPYKRNANWSSEDDDMDSSIKNAIADAFGLSYDSLSGYEKEILEKAYDQTMTSRKERGDHIYLLYGGYEPLTVAAIHLLNRKAGIAWSSYSHTAVPLPVYAIGCESWRFDGMYQNSDIARKLAATMKVQFDNN